MALQNALGNIALDASVQQVKTAVDAVTAALNDGVSVTGSTVALDSNTLAALENINASTGALTDAQLRASAIQVSDGGESLTVDGVFWQNTQPVSAAMLPLPTGASSEATLAAVQALSENVRDLTDTLVTLMSAILEKMPRVTATDQVATNIENTPTVNIAASQTLATLTNLVQMGGQEAVTVARSQMMSGATYVYDNVKVS